MEKQLTSEFNAEAVANDDHTDMVNEQELLKPIEKAISLLHFFTQMDKIPSCVSAAFCLSIHVDGHRVVSTLLQLS